MKTPVVYIAAAYPLRDWVAERLAAPLAAQGLRIGASWLEETAPIDAHHMDMSGDRNRELADRDVDEVRKADVVVLLAEGADAPPARSRGGMHVEYGVALATGAECFLVGEPEHMFHHVIPESNRFKTSQEATAVLAERFRID